MRKKITTLFFISLSGLFLLLGFLAINKDFFCVQTSQAQVTQDDGYVCRLHHAGQDESFTTLESAINKASEDDVIYMLEDYEISQTITINKTVTIQADSKDVCLKRKTKDVVFSITSYGWLNLGNMDNEPTGTLTIRSERQNGVIGESCIIENNGTLYLYEGIVINDLPSTTQQTNKISTSYTDRYSAIHNKNNFTMKGGLIEAMTFAIQNDGTFNMLYDAKITNSGCAIRNGSTIYQTNGVININGGVIENNNCGINNDNGSIRVLGGKIINNPQTLPENIRENPTFLGWGDIFGDIGYKVEIGGDCIIGSFEQINNIGPIKIKSELKNENVINIYTSQPDRYVQTSEQFAGSPIIEYEEGLTANPNKFNIVNRFYRIIQGDNDKSSNLYLQKNTTYKITYNFEHYHLDNIIQEYEPEEEIVLPQDPVPEEYYLYFSGWYQERTLDNLFVFPELMPTNDLLVYCGYSLRHYIVNAETVGMGGSVTPLSEQNIVFDDRIKYQISTDEGYVLNEIEVDNNPISISELEKTKETGVFEFSISLYDFRLYDNSPQEQHKIKFIFTIVPYSITFDLNYANAEKIVKEFTKDEPIEFPNSLTRTGYTFDGWYTDSNCQTPFTLTKMPAENLTVYAKWNINKYTITATAGENGSISPSGELQIEYNKSQTFVFKANDGYKVSDIKIDNQSLENELLTNAIEKGYTFSNISSSHTISVEFAKQTYSITFNYNYSDSPNAQVKEFLYESEITLIDTPQRKGYSFAGWYEDADCVQEFKIKNMPSHNLIVYAKWNINTYTITATAGENGNISPSGSVVKEYNTSQTFTFTPNEGYEISDIKIDEVSIDKNLFSDHYDFTNINDNHSIYVAFSPRQYKIILKLNYLGAIDIEKTFEFGSTIVLPTGVTQKGFKFVGWYEDAQCQTSFNLEKMPARDLTVYAKWEIQKFTIKVICGPHGSISPDTDQQVEYGGSISFTITPEEKYEVSSVKIDGREVEQPNVTIVALSHIDDDHTISVEFQKRTVFVVTFFLDNTLSTNKVEKSFTVGETIVPPTMPNVFGKWFKGWYYDNSFSTEMPTIMPDEDFSVVPCYELKTYHITATAGENGSISPDGETKTDVENNNIKYTFIPKQGYKVASIAIDKTYLLPNEVSEAITNGLFFDLNKYADRGDSNDKDEYHTISVVFEILTFSITATSGPNGYISPNGNQTKEYGSSIKFEFVANEGYEVADIKIDNASLSKENLLLAIQDGYLFENIQGNHSIYVEFIAKIYTITFNLNYQNTENIVLEFRFQSTITLPQTPSRTGYSFVNWYEEIGCENVFVAGPMPAHDLTVYAKWEILKFTITASHSEHGNITPDGEIIKEYGTEQKFTFSPDKGYKVATIVVDGKQLATREFEEALKTGYTFSNISDEHTIHVNFSIITYQLVFNLNYENGQNIIKEFAFGENIVLPDTPQRKGYTFVSWFNEETCQHEFNLDTMPDYSLEVFAKWDINEYTITATADENGSISPAGQIKKVFNTNQNFTFTPNEGYELLDVIIDGVSLQESKSYNYEFSNIEDNHTIHVTFKAKDYMVTFDLNYAESSPINSVFAYNTEIQTPQTPQRLGYTFAGWYNETTCQTLFTFTLMPAHDLTVYAKWDINIFSVNISCGENGQISPNGKVNLEFNSSQDFEITADEGYHIQMIILDDEEQEQNGQVKNLTYSIKNISSDHTLQVIFAINKYKIKLNIENKGGNVDYDEPLTDIAHGSSRRLTITTDYNYLIDRVIINGELATLSGNTILIENIVGDLEVSVFFKIDNFWITTGGIVVIIVIAVGSIIILTCILYSLIKKYRRKRMMDKYYQ